MIDTEKLLSILIDDDVEQFSGLYSNLTEKTFKITSNKYKYINLLKNSEGAPLLSISAFFCSQKCYEYLVNVETDIPSFDISPLAYACAGGNMFFIHDISSRYQETADDNCADFAITFGHLDAVKWLFLKGYNFNISQITIAFRMGYEDISNFFLKNQDFTKFSNFDYFLVSSACEGGNEKILDTLLTEYKHKKFTKKDYQFFINTAISNGNISCVKYLMAHSQTFFPRVYSSFIQPSFQFASSYDYLDIIVYLTSLGGKIDDIESEDSPLIIALTSNSYNTSKYFLNQLPKIDTNKIFEYIETVFCLNYSFPIVQLLLKYIDKTLFDMREYLAKLAFKFNILTFFHNLTENEISLDFIKIEYFDDCIYSYDLYSELFYLNVRFQFDIRNKIFLNALKNAEEAFINFAIKNGAVLNDEIIEASECLNFKGKFYKNERLIEKLFESKINLSKYPNFLINLISSCGRKVFIYELLAINSLEFGACVNKEVILLTIHKKWIEFFRKATEIQYFQLDVDDIPLSEVTTGQYYYEQILKIIFDKQPLLVYGLIRKINRLQIKNNVTHFIQSCRPIVPTVSLSPSIDMSIDIENLLIPIYDRRK